MAGEMPGSDEGPRCWNSLEASGHVGITPGRERGQELGNQGGAGPSGDGRGQEWRRGGWFEENTCTPTFTAELFTKLRKENGLSQGTDWTVESEAKG